MFAMSNNRCGVILLDLGQERWIKVRATVNN
jgi:hypothetical protein